MLLPVEAQVVVKSRGVEAVGVLKVWSRTGTTEKSLCHAVQPELHSAETFCW